MHNKSDFTKINHQIISNKNANSLILSSYSALSDDIIINKQLCGNISNKNKSVLY